MPHNLLYSHAVVLQAVQEHSDDKVQFLGLKLLLAPGLVQDSNHKVSTYHAVYSSYPSILGDI